MLCIDHLPFVCHNTLPLYVTHMLSLSSLHPRSGLCHDIRANLEFMHDSNTKEFRDGVQMLFTGCAVENIGILFVIYL